MLGELLNSGVWPLEKVSLFEFERKVLSSVSRHLSAKRSPVFTNIRTKYEIRI